MGLELLVETARLWRSLGSLRPAGQFRIDGVTGPDEYSALADNNVYTNLLAQHNLRAAAEACRRHPQVACTLGVDADELARWSEAAEQMFIPYDQEPRVTPQDDVFPRTSGGTSRTRNQTSIRLFLHVPVLRPLSQAGRQAG